MSETEQLLKLTPTDALTQMLTNANELRYPLYGLTASLPEVVSGIRTRVTLSGRSAVAKDDFIHYEGSSPLEYSRILVRRVFDGVLAGYKPALPVSSRDVLNELTARTGIAFDLDDFIHEEINNTNAVDYRLKAKSESLRWIGEISLNLSSHTQLSDIVDPDTVVEVPGNRTPYLDVGQFSLWTNATYILYNWLTFLTYVVVDQAIQDSHERIGMELGNYLRHVRALGQGAWVVTNTKTSRNLYNARFIYHGRQPNAAGLGPIPEGPDESMLLILRLDPEYCDDITVTDVFIRYIRTADFHPQLQPRARLTNVSGPSALNGTTHSHVLSSLTQGQVITTVLPDINLDPDGSDIWVAVNSCAVNNLNQSVVIYNGPLRPVDDSSIYEDVTHVCVVNVNPRYNAEYRGNLSIYYRMS